MTRVTLLATGGTIASRAGPSGRHANAHAQDLLASVRGLPSGMMVLTEDFATKGSYAFDTSDLLALARRVRQSLEQDVDGVVVTHGTDVMEESAFLVSLVHNDLRPVVFTGSQRPFDDPAPDGPANLRDAILVAGARVAREAGVLVTFDSLVYPARGVRKVDTSSLHAFEAPGRGPVLRVVGANVVELGRCPRAKPLPLDLELDHLPRVDVIPAYPGADGVLLRASLEAGAAGVVIAAVGAGNVGPALLDAAAEALASGVPVLVSSRVTSGPVLPLYAGAGARLEELGAVFGGDLSPWQARVLLAVSCTVSADHPQDVVRDWLNT